MRCLLLFFTILLSIPAQASPKLSNFRILDTELSRVYFDASSDITELTIAGFVINGKTISGVSIVGLGGFFSVTEPFDYWDNITIRLEDGDGIVLDFSLEYVDNLINEPTADIFRYVTPTALGGGDGHTESTAWTWGEAFDNVQEGTTVWVKSGDYGNEVLALLHKHGTAINPIKFIGYKQSIGDIEENYLMNTDVDITRANLNNNFSTLEMPTLTGKDIEDRNEDDIAIMLTDVSFIFFRNIQIRKYANGIQNRQGNSNHSSHIVFDRINGYDFIQRHFNSNLSNTYGHFINLEGTHESLYGPDYTYSNFCKLSNIVAKGGNLGTIFVTGWGNNLFENIKLFDEPISNPHADYEVTNKDQSDYYLAVGGSHNIIRDVYAYNYQTWLPTTNENNDAPGGHGIGIRSGYTWVGVNGGSKYNLIDDCHTLGMTEGLYIRNLKADFNVIKNSTAKRFTQMIGDSPDYYELNNAWNGVVLWGGTDHNIIENIEITNMSSAILLVDNNEDEDGIPSSILSAESRLLDIGNDNLLRNIKAVGFRHAVKTNSFLGSIIQDDRAKMHGNKIYNSVFTSGYYLFDPNYSDIDEFKFVNSIIINFNNTIEPILAEESPRNSTEAATFTNCNFYNNTSLADINWLIDDSRPVDNNNINVNANLNANLEPTDTSPISITEGGILTSDCQFDFDNNERIAPISIGAHEYSTLTNNAIVYIKTFLEGPYHSDEDLMRDILRQSNKIPFIEPYSTLGFYQVNGGGESTSPQVFEVVGDNAIVDWVFVELRDPNSPATILATQSALIQRDGDVVSVDGVSPITFENLPFEQYLLALKHRNHLGIRSQSAYSTNNVVAINFTISNMVYGANAMSEINGVMVQISGDANHDGQVNVSDLNNYWRLQNSMPYNYITGGADYNMDGTVNAIDQNTHWRINNGRVQFLE